jgi:hypothetical protein
VPGGVRTSWSPIVIADVLPQCGCSIAGRSFLATKSYRGIFDAQMMELTEAIFGRRAAEHLARRRRERPRARAAVS